MTSEVIAFLIGSFLMSLVITLVDDETKNPFWKLEFWITEGWWRIPLYMGAQALIFYVIIPFIYLAATLAFIGAALFYGMKWLFEKLKL